MCDVMEAMMTKRRIEVGIGSRGEALDGFEKAWRAAERRVKRTTGALDLR